MSTGQSNSSLKLKSRKSNNTLSAAYFGMVGFFWPSDKLGRYPLISDVNKIILKYISYLQSKEQSSLVIQSLVMSINLHSNGKTCVYANLIKMRNYYNIAFNFYHDNYPAFCRSHAQEMYYPLETFPLQFTIA